MEKAWAKVKGNYLIADAGMIENGLYMMVGCPVIRYETSEIYDMEDAETMFDLIKAADSVNYIMGATTQGYGNDQ